MRGAVSLAAVLLVSIAAIAIVALSYTAVKTPTRTTPQAQTGRCFWIDAEFEKRADGLGYDPYVFFRSDDGNGFDDIYLTRDGALVAGPNRWNKSNGPFVFYPQYTGGVLGTGQTISYNGRDDNCGSRGNSSTIACSVDQSGNLIETSSCKSRGGGGGNQPPPTTVPTQPQSSNQVCSGNSCNDCILTIRDDVLDYYRDTGGWDISCPNQTAIVNNWCGIDPTGCNNVRSNECAQQCGITPTNPPPTNTPTRTPTPTPTSIPTPTSTPVPTPVGITCGYIEQDCCLNVGRGCIDPSLVCTGKICVYPTSIPTNTPNPTQPVSTSTPRYVDPGTPKKFTASIVQTGQQIVNRLTGRENTPTPAQQQIQQSLSITGKVKVNNSLGIPIVETKVALYKTKGDTNAIPADARSGEYQYNNIPQGEYFIKAWVRDQNGNWYQNAPCTPVGDDYDCVVKPGETKNLTVNIGPQGLRGIVSKTQNTSTNIALSIKQAIINLPVIGGFINVFIISAF